MKQKIVSLPHVILQKKNNISFTRSLRRAAESQEFTEIFVSNYVLKNFMYTK